MKDVRMVSIMGVVIGAVMTFIAAKEAINCVVTGNIAVIIVPILMFGLGIVAFIIVGISDRQHDKTRTRDMTKLKKKKS
jgi:hypothetical protein